MATINYKEKYEKAVRAAMLAKQDTESAVTIRILEEIFPELKESEDERIRKEIIEHIKWSYDEQECADEEMHRWISWLEKQSEHTNFLNKIQIGDKVTRNRDGVLVNLSQLNRIAKKDEKQDEQKLNCNNKELKGVVIAELSKYNRYDLNAPWALDSTGLQYPLYFANLGAKWQKEQKPAWSEEDEKVLHAIRNALNYEKPRNYLKSRDFEFTDILDWLKSLKERMKKE